MPEGRGEKVMVVGAIIQARLNSHRLSGKVIKKLGNLRVLDYVVKSLHHSMGVDRTILAIPQNDSLLLESLDESMITQGMPVYGGSEEDVMDRIIKAAEKFHIEVILRICADSPFIMSWFVDYCLYEYRRKPVDYFYTTKMPKGQNVEIMTLLALKKAYLVSNSEEKEHVTLYFQRHPRNFKITHFPISFALDTLKDYERLKDIARFYG